MQNAGDLLQNVFSPQEYFGLSQVPKWEISYQKSRQRRHLGNKCNEKSPSCKKYFHYNQNAKWKLCAVSFPASWIKIKIKKIKRIRKHTQKTTKRNPLDACEISESKPKEAEPEAVADLTQTRTHRPPDPDRKHFKCLRFHSQLKCECSRLRKARRRRGRARGSRGVSEEGAGKTCSNLLDISSFAYCGNFICLAKISSIPLSFLYSSYL